MTEKEPDWPTLEERIGREPLPLETATAHAFDLLAALARAHADGRAHGAFTAAQVRIAPDGVAHLDGAPQPVDSAAAAAQDVLAFGAVFHRMVTGRAPAGEPPSKLEPQLPPAIDDFTLRCLHQDPDQRFENGGTTLEALTAVARAHGLPRPLEAEEAPRPARHASWPDGVAATGGRVLASGLLLGSPWVMGGLALALPELGRAPYACTVGWLVLAALLELRAPGSEQAQAKLGRFAIAVFLIVIAFGQFGTQPVTLASLASPLWFTLIAAAVVAAGPACLEWIREPLASDPAAGSRVRFQGQAGTRASVDGEPDSDLPFELELPPGGHEIAVRQATGTVTFLLRLPAADYLVIDIPAVRLDGRFPTMAEEQETESGFSPTGALASAAVMLGPVLALAIGGAGLLINPGSRVASLDWPVARPEAEYQTPPPPPRDAQWARIARTSLTRVEQKAYQLMTAAEQKPAKALDLFAQSYAVAPTTRAALGAAEAAARAKKPDQARAWLAKVADEDLTNRLAVQRAAQVALGLGDTDAGLGIYADAMQRLPADEDLRARYVLALVRARREQSATAILVADNPTAARLERALRLLLEAGAPLAPALDVVDRVVKDAKLRTVAMPEMLLAFAEKLPAARAAEACRLVKALLASGLRHPRLTAESRRSCR